MHKATQEPAQQLAQEPAKQAGQVLVQQCLEPGTDQAGIRNPGNTDIFHAPAEYIVQNIFARGGTIAEPMILESGIDQQ